MTYIPAAMAMGELHFSTPAATTLTAQNTWYKVAGTTTLLTSHGFDMPENNRLRYTGKQTVHLHAGCSFTFTCSAASQVIEFGVYADGNLITGSEQSLLHSTGTDRNSTALHTMSMETTNGYLELWARNLTSASKTITVEDGNIFAVGMRV